MCRAFSAYGCGALSKPVILLRINKQTGHPLADEASWTIFPRRDHLPWFTTRDHWLGGAGVTAGCGVAGCVRCAGGATL